MFSFRKKDKEKEKEKKKEKEKEKEKKKNDKEKKGKDRTSMTQDELNKLDEVKKGLFRRHSEKESIGGGGSSKLFRKSGSYVPKTENSNEGSGSTPQVQIVDGSKSEKNSTVTLKKINSLPGRKEPPMIQPKPKSILKGSSNYGPGLPNQGVTGNIDDSSTLQRNTLLNEIQIQSNFVDKSNESSKELTHTGSPQKPAMGLQGKPSIIINDENAVPLSPAEKTFDFDLSLPSIVPPKPGRIRELNLKRQPGGDFGFSLRKGVVMERHNLDTIGSKRTVIFAEPGTGPKATETGLLPGDRLIEVNGTNVENSKREEIIDMIRKSTDCVVLKVQPVPDLMELSVRTAADGGKVDLQENVAKGGTLKRSGSVRYKKMPFSPGPNILLQFHLDDSHNMEDSEEPLPDIAVTRRSPCGRRHLGTRSQCYSGEEEQFYSAALAQTRYPMPLYSTLEHVRNYKLPVPAYWTKSEDDVKSEKAWLESDKVWLIHKGGFSSATLLKTNGMSPLPEGKVKVKVDHGGEIIEVDEEDIEKANPPQFDKTEDITTLRYLNESSILHILRQRYGSNLVHSYAGPTMIIINPMAPLSIYSEKVVHMFRGCKQEDMPPHIYAVAQHAHRELLSNRIDQSILLLGRSGSGKTTSARHLLQYLILASGSVNNYLTVDKLNAMEMLLESFGNSRILLNTNATRFTQLISLDFDFSGQVSSATIQTLMLEKSRLVRRPEGEPNFHIFYYMLTGVDSQLRNELQLTCLTDPNQFMTPLQRNEDRQKAAQFWAKVNNAMEILGFSQEEMKAIFYVLASIYHLGAAGATKGNNNKSQFSKPAAAQKAASLLGIKVEELSRMIFSPSTGSGGTLTRSASMRISNAADRQAGETSTSAFDALEGFVTGLYSELFNVVVALINRALTTNYRNLGSITILDTPGFQNPASCGRQTGSTFEDLCCNYIQERLQLFFHDATFTLQQDRYSQENIECDFEFVNTSPAAMVSLIDRPPQQTLLRSSNPDLRDSDKKGLLWMLDDEAIFPGATEDSFMERLFTQHGDHPVRRDSLLRKGSLGHTFILNHFQGTNPVQYNATGWLKVCRENAVSKIAIHVLQDSSRDNISELFTTMRGPVSTTVSGSIVGEKPTSSLRRAASMRRTFTSGGANIKRKSICLQIKLQVGFLDKTLNHSQQLVAFLKAKIAIETPWDTLIETLRRTKCHFVHCLLPQANAGLCEVKTSQTNSSSAETNLLNVPLVRSQLRGSETLEAIRIFRLGFPDFMQFTEFKHRFDVLAPPGPKSDSMDERQAIKQLIDHMDIDKLNYRIGLSQVFFRAGALTGLEVTRDEKITGTMIKFQAFCRGYLGRKKVEKLRLQHTAISCIQKNVKKFMLIRDWPWWRLYVRVKPLLNVHRTEEELKNKEAELEQLKVKFEKVERERNEYKQHCDKLDSRLTELNADLAEEATTSSHASELLDQETAERMRLEKELKEIQTKYNKARQQNDKLEREVMQYRLWQATTFEGEYDEENIDESVYKDRYEKVRKELGFLKQQLQHQHEEELQQEQNLKKHLEKKYHDSVQECEDFRQLLSASKKKATKLNSEMQDIKRHLNEQTSRNNELERKQRKFDSELNMALQESKEERNHREKLHREKDELMALKYSLEQQNMKLKMDNEFNIEKIERLEKDLNDLTESGGKDDREYLALKRAKQELAAKVAEQEEELDDQAGQIQQLEQSKLRLEMNIQNLRQQNMKELEEKEEELEDMRYSTQKKLKQLESQLEEEYDDKRLLMQDKRELERQIQEFTLRDTERNSDNEKRLKKDLRRTKALLRDAETVIQKQQSSENSKVTIRQLRNQLEDAQFTSASAVKAKKNLEIELEELQQQIEEMSKGKQDAETRYMTVLRELTDIQTRLEETEEDMNEVMAKYTAAVKQRSVDQLTMSEQLRQIEELENERDKLKYEVTDLASKVQTVEDQSVNKLQAARLETKVRDLESKLELETSTRHRLESTVNRNKEQIEKVMEERDNISSAKHQAEEAIKKLQRQMRDLREEASDYQKRELETNHKKQELESRLTDLEIDYDQSQSDLKLAFKRISGLQAALEESIESEDDDSYLSYSDVGDSDDDFDVDPEDTFLADHKQKSSLYGSTGTRSRSISAASLEQDTDGLDEGSSSHAYQSASSDA